MNFLEWVMQTAWVVWLAVALLLSAAELLTLDLTLLMLASGAAAGGLTALIFPSLIWLQAVVAVVVAVLTLALLRPLLLDRVRSAPGYRSALDSLVGSTGKAIGQITSQGGEVWVEGQIWQARPYDEDVCIPADSPIEVFGLEGLTLLVYPAVGNRQVLHIEEGNNA